MSQPAAAPSPAPDPLEGNVKYKTVRFLNKGAFGQVILAQDIAVLPTERYVAIKLLKRGPACISKYVTKEVLNHSTLQHPSIIKLIEVFLTRWHLAIVMEYAPSGDLFQLVKQQGGLSENDARWYFRQIVVGMDFCHKKHVVNRDIKLENTLLRHREIKLCDFGYSKNLQYDSVPRSKVGTLTYSAPEVLQASARMTPQGDPQTGYSGEMVDVWSAGVMLYIMLFRQYPFERVQDQALPNEYERQQRIQEECGAHLEDSIVKAAEERAQQQLFIMTMSRILKSDYAFPEHKPISESCKSLVRGILQVDVRNRLTLQQIMQHPWLQEGMADQRWATYNETLLAEEARNPQRQEQWESLRRHITHLVADAASTADAPAGHYDHVPQPGQAGPSQPRGAQRSPPPGAGGGGGGEPQGAPTDDLIDMSITDRPGAARASPSSPSYPRATCAAAT